MLTGVVEPGKLAALSEVLDKYCRTTGTPEGEERDAVARLLLNFADPENQSERQMLADLKKRIARLNHAKP